MRRFRGRRSSGRRSSKARKTRWGGGIFQANTVLDLDYNGGNFSWFSFWAKWPSGSTDPQTGRLEPSEETLVRSLMKATVANLTNTDIVDFVFGLIAFDGGAFPEFYEAATFNSVAALVAPPNPAVDVWDDWIIRQPFGFAGSSGFALVNSGEPSHIWQESRAMRKLPPSVGVLFVAGGIGLVGAPAATHFQVTTDIRYAVRSGYTF